MYQHFYVMLLVIERHKVWPSCQNQSQEPANVRHCLLRLTFSVCLEQTGPCELRSLCLLCKLSMRSRLDGMRTI